MEHSYIEEHNIADRYLLGKLSAEERRRFEKHFENCRQCIDQLKTIDDLCTGLRIVAAEDLWRSRTKAEAGSLSRILRLGRAGQVALLAGAILLVALPLGLLIPKWSNARRDLAQDPPTEWRRKHEETGAVEPSPSREMESRDRQSSVLRDRPAPQPKSKRKGRSSPSNGAERVAPHELVMPVFALNSTRSGSLDLSQPTTRIKLKPSDKLITLLLELGPDPDIQSYRAAISTAGSQSVWRESQLKPITKGTLALRFDSNLFKPDKYLLTLEGLNAGNQYVLIARYTFLVVAQ
jgi:hypothetical protein